VNVVVIDHGLYCEEPDAFRTNYAAMFKAIVDGDGETLKRVARAWGIRDHELFASFQILRPYRASGVGAPVTASNISRAEILEMQANAKARVRRLLADSSLTPPELSLVGRHLNLIRSINKTLGSPVNRPRVLATYANRAIAREQTAPHAWASRWLSRAAFEARMLAIETVFLLTESWRRVRRWVTGADSGGFEDMMEREVASSVERKLGLKVNAGGDADAGSTG